MTKALLITGGEHHPFESCSRILADVLKERGAAECVVTTDRNALQQLDGIDVVIAYVQGGTLTAAQEQSLCDWVQAGGAFIGIHSAADAWVENKRYMEMLGSRFVDHGPMTEILVNMADEDHDTTIRCSSFRIYDEFYVLKQQGNAEWHEVMNAAWKFESHPMAYVREYGKGRVFYTALGHDERAFKHASFQKLIHRAIIWSTNSVRKTGPIRMGIVGYGGMFAMGKCHAETIGATKGLELKAICDIDPARTKVASEEHKGIQTYDHISKLIASDTIDHCIVVTPHNTHAPLAIELMEAGIGVVSEKPFCTSIEQATAMIDKSREKGVSLATFHNRRWDPDYLTIKNVVEQGTLGELFHIETYMGSYGHPGTWWRSDKEISGGAMFDWGAHFIDWMLNLMPYKIESVYGFSHKLMWHDVTNEDHSKAIIRFEGGRSAEFELSSLSSSHKSKFRILGTKGGLTNKWEEPLNVTSHVRGYLENITVPLVEPRWAIDYYLQLADHLLFGEQIPVTAESARRVIAVLDLACQSAKTGQPIRMPEEIG